MKRPPLDELISLWQATVAAQGTTTAPGAFVGNSFIDAGLSGAGVNSFVSMLAVIYPGEPLLVDSMDITAFDNVTGEVTLHENYKGGQIPTGAPYKIVTFRFVPAEVAAIMASLGAMDAAATADDLSDITTTSVQAKLRRILLRMSAATQIIQVPVTAPANAGDVVLATVTDQECSIGKVNVRSNGATTADLTNIGVYAGAGKVVTLIDSVTGARANIAAADQQVGNSPLGGVVLSPTKTIVITLTGTGATPVNLTVTIEYKACVSGGYLA